MPNLSELRPFISDQDYLNRLYDMGIFEKKLDVWAYCVAYALGKGLPPADNHGPQMGSILAHLDGEMLETLRVAVVGMDSGKLGDDELLDRLSAYASAGMVDIRRQIEGKSRTEVYEFLLGQVEV